MVMDKFYTWLFIVLAVAIALGANALSTLWAESDNKWNWLLLAVILISPLVFISFGLVTSRVGLVVSSGTIDSLLTISTIALALIVFKEWDTVSLAQYIGIGFTITGIVLIHLYE